MIFETGADDLAFVAEILGAGEANDAVYQKRLEGAGYAVGPRFEGELIDSVMRLGGERAALAGFEVHCVVSYPCDIALTMVLEKLVAAFAEQVEGDSETAVSGFRAGYGLEEKVDRGSAIE